MIPGEKVVKCETGRGGAMQRDIHEPDIWLAKRNARRKAEREKRP